ncbi:MAG: DNA-3-methyladenine glycosylase 2 family protein [Bacteroidota bacterium]
MLSDPTARNDADFQTGVETLVKRDADLARLVARDGTPPMWRRKPGFATLVHIILEQQVSLASAQAAFDRLQAALSDFSPTAFLDLSDDALKEIGFSRQKTRYVRGLSESLLRGTLSLETLSLQHDDAIRANLTQLKGIGRWTADIYLLMALGRLDVWPGGDLALVKSIRQVKQLPVTATADDLATIASAWQPWRSVAACILWNHYLIHMTRRAVTNS